jgi:hypothetical protein
MNIHATQVIQAPWAIRIAVALSFLVAVTILARRGVGTTGRWECGAKLSLLLLLTFVSATAVIIYPTQRPLISLDLRAGWRSIDLAWILLVSAICCLWAACVCRAEGNGEAKR